MVLLNHPYAVGFVLLVIFFWNSSRKKKKEKLAHEAWVAKTDKEEIGQSCMLDWEFSDFSVEQIVVYGKGTIINKWNNHTYYIEWQGGYRCAMPADQITYYEEDKMNEFQQQYNVYCQSHTADFSRGII